jgi:hypothetical protein
VKAACGRNVVRYEVVERNWLRFEVHAICDNSPGQDQEKILLFRDGSSGPGHPGPRHLVRTFWRQEPAIKAASGLADGTWSARGPIRYTVTMGQEA